MDIMGTITILATLARRANQEKLPHPAKSASAGVYRLMDGRARTARYGIVGSVQATHVKQLVVSRHGVLQNRAAQIMQNLQNL